MSTIADRLAEENRITSDDPIYNELINRIEEYQPLIEPLFPDFKSRFLNLKDSQGLAFDDPKRVQASRLMAFDLIRIASMYLTESDTEESGFGMYEYILNPVNDETDPAFGLMWTAFSLAQLEQLDDLVLQTASILAKRGFDRARLDFAETYTAGGIDAAETLGDSDSLVCGAEICLYGGYTLFRLGKEEEAQAAYMKGGQLLDQIQDPTDEQKEEIHTLQCALLYRLGQCQSFYGEKQQALASFKEALACAETEHLAQTDPAMFANILTGISRIEIDQGNLDSAMMLLKTAKPLVMTDSDREVQEALAQVLYAQSLIQYRRNKLEEAKQNAEQGLRILDSLYGEDSVELCNMLNHLGWIMRRTGSYRQAENLFYRSWKIRVDHYGRSNILTAISAANRAGAAAMRMDEMGKGYGGHVERLFAEALECMQACAKDANQFRISGILLDYTEFLISTKQYIRAEDMADQAIEKAVECGNGLYALYGLEKILRLAKLQANPELFTQGLKKAEELAGQFKMKNHPVMKKIQDFAEDNIE